MKWEEFGKVKGCGFVACEYVAVTRKRRRRGEEVREEQGVY